MSNTRCSLALSLSLSLSLSLCPYRYVLSGSDLYEYNDRAMAHNVASTLFDIGRNKAKAKLRGRRKTNDRRSSSKGSRLSSGEAGRGVTLSRSGFWTGDDVASLSKGMAAEVQKMAEDEAVEAQQSSFVFPPDANEPNLKTNKMLLKSRSALMATLTLGGRDAQSFSVSNPLASKRFFAKVHDTIRGNPAASFFV